MRVAMRGVVGALVSIACVANAAELCVRLDGEQGCYESIGQALAASAVGDTIVVHQMALEYAEGGLVVDRRSLVAAPGHRPVIKGAPDQAITVTLYAPANLSGIEVKSSGENVPGEHVAVFVDVDAYRPLPPATDHNTNMGSLTVRAIGANAVGLKIVSRPAGVTIPGQGSYIYDLIATTVAADANTRALVMDAQWEFSGTDCIIKADGSGVAIDLVRTISNTQPLITDLRGRTEVHVTGNATGLRRTLSTPCGPNLTLEAAFISDDPPGTGGTWRYVKEVGSCAPDPYDHALRIDSFGFQEDSARNAFVFAPKTTSAHWRGSAVPFPCSGSGYGLGVHWFDTVAGKDKVCTSTGWKTVTTS